MPLLAYYLTHPTDAGSGCRPNVLSHSGSEHALMLNVKKLLRCGRHELRRACDKTSLETPKHLLHKQQSKDQKC